MTQPMTGPMTGPVLHAAPPLRDVLREQVRVVGLALRWPAAAFVVAMAIIATIFAIELRLENRSFDFHPEQLMIPALVGLLLPIGVWRREQRFGAGFLWTLPVDRRAHALARVMAGWVWLMAAVALYFFLLLTLALSSGDRLLDPETLQFLPAGSPYPSTGTLQPGAWTTVQWTPTALLWLVPFTGATGAYLFASAFALGARHPLRWILGTGLGLFLVLAVADAADVEWITAIPDRVFRPLFLGPFGISTLLTARTEFLKIGTTLTNGESVTVWRGLPNIAGWAMATLIWTSLGLAALLAAAGRHRERRRR